MLSHFRLPASKSGLKLSGTGPINLPRCRHAVAQTNLGAAYGAGQGVPQDWATSTRWYLLAAEQGNARAQLNLGVAFANGQGIPRDLVQAYKWYSLSILAHPASDKVGL